MLSNVCAIFVPWISLWTMNLYFKGDTQRWLIYRHSPTVSPSLSHTRTHTSNGPLRAASTNHFNTNFCSCRPFGSRFLKVQSNELITSAMWPKINHNFTGLHSKLTSITPRQPPCHLSTHARLVTSHTCHVPVPISVAVDPSAPLAIGLVRFNEPQTGQD